MKFDPRDADSYYFEGVCYQEMKQFDKAIAILQQALEINPAARIGGVCIGARAATLGQCGWRQGSTSSSSST